MRRRPARARAGGDDGTAVLEVLVLGTGLLVPLLYGALSVMAVQSASFAATGAAREAARAFVSATTVVEGRAHARAATGLALADAGLPAVTPSLACVGACLAPGARVDVSVSVDVPLPLVPWSASVTVVGRASMPVDRYREAP